jgi:predicted GTPase
VVVLMLDAQENIAESDAHIAGFILESGRALVVAVNKWDGLTSDKRDEVKNDIDRKLDFLSFAETKFISALKGTGINHLMKAVDTAYAAATAKLSTPRLTRALEEAVEKQEPKRKGTTRPKMRYAHQGGQSPTSATWKSISAKPSTWSAPRCGSNCAAARTRLPKAARSATSSLRRQGPKLYARPRKQTWAPACAGATQSFASRPSR